jgi:hypothetical protein
VKGHTKEESLAGWRKIGDASLPAEVTVAEIAGMIGLSRPAVAQWLRRHVPASGWRLITPRGRATRLYRLEAVQEAVRTAQGPGNRTAGPARAEASVRGWDTRLSRMIDKDPNEGSPQ